jgi:5'-nucleotidase
MRLRSMMFVALLVLLFSSVLSVQAQASSARTSLFTPTAAKRLNAPTAQVSGPGDGAGTLTLLHNNDGESSLLPIPNTVQPGTGYPNTSPVTLATAGVAAFKTVTEQNIAQARAAGNAVVNVYAGDAFLASATLQCTLPVNSDKPFYDAIAQRQIPYTAHVIGNHEFDYGPDFLERFIRAFNDGGTGAPTQPFLSANLDFSREPGFADLLDVDGLIIPPVTDGRVVGKAMIATDNGQRFGIVAATTPDLPTISSPRNVSVTPDLQSTANVVQQQIDRLYNDFGVRKIIFVSHLQGLEIDRQLIPLLSRVDVAVAGGGDELLLNPDAPISKEQQKLPGEQSPEFGTYPILQADKDRRDVPIVTTAGNYKYLGRIDVQFDANGEVAQVLDDASYPRRIIPQSPEATALRVADAVAKDRQIVETVEEPLQACLQELRNTPIATTEVILDVSNAGVRSRETNSGNLITDAFVAAYDRYALQNGLPPRSPTNPVIALTNGGGIRQNAGDILPTTGSVPGPITRLDTLNVLPFLNYVAVVPNVTPQDMKTIFERAASQLPNRAGSFLQVSGIRVTYNPRNPVGSRVGSLRLADGRAIIQNGAPVAGAPNVTVVTNNFTAGGGDGYVTLRDKPNKKNLLGTGAALITYEEAWVEYLTQNLNGLIDDADPRYRPGGEGRILILSRYAFAPLMLTNASGLTVPQPTR